MGRAQAEILRQNAERRQKNRIQGFIAVVQEILRHKPRRVGVCDNGCDRAKGQHDSR